MKAAKTTAYETMIQDCSTQLREWLQALHEFMPDYFFTTFSPEQIKKILPTLVNLRRDSGIQQIRSENRVVFVYLKSDEHNLVATAQMMKEFNITGAAIHESTQKIVVDGSPSTLVIEYYETGDPMEDAAPTHKLKDVQGAYKKRFGSGGEPLREVYDRINWTAVADLDLDRLVGRVHHVLRVQSEDTMDLEVEKAGDEIRLTMSLSNCPRRNFYRKYIECLASYGFEVRRAYLRRITRQPNEDDCRRMPVSINTLYLKGDGRGTSINSKKMKEMLAELPLVKWTTMDDLTHRELVVNHGWKLSDANFVRAAGEFVHSQLSFVDRNAYNSQDLYRFMVLYEPTLRDLLAYFHERFDPSKSTGRKKSGLERKIKRDVKAVNTGNHEKDEQVKTIFSSLLNFVSSIRKTNFFSERKTALSFRLDPAFMRFYGKLSDQYSASFPKDLPFGVFYFHRERGFGFQVRFSNIARGGWRTVIPRQTGRALERTDAYSFARDEIYREVFVLAHTQHMKNKDIYEGGSKMICLLDHAEEIPLRPFLFEAQRSVCRAFLDLINCDRHGKLRDQAVIDHLGAREIIEIGPDENMFDPMIEWIGDLAVERGYLLGGGLISGKGEAGVNHKEYGVTSFGVHQFLLKTLDELDVDPGSDEFSLKISGGPFGDVAGNALKLLFEKNGAKALFPNLKIVAITDGPAAAYDPEGLDKKELELMIHAANLDAFPPAKLRGEGAYVVFSEPTIEKGNEWYRLAIREKGRLLEKKIGRDEFMKVFQDNLMVHHADIFLPCGGRPSTIDATNWDRYQCHGKPSSRAIIEGANSFITPDARDKLQEAGVWIVKDASANKCGVITSSYEILSGLMLEASEFKKIKRKLVPQILEILRGRARREADWLYHQFKRTGVKMTDLTERLSREINAKNEEFADYLRHHHELISDALILVHLPPIFASMDPAILQRVPEEYKVAIAAVELAGRVVYGRAMSVEDEIATALKTLEA